MFKNNFNLKKLSKDPYSHLLWVSKHSSHFKKMFNTLVINQLLLYILVIRKFVKRPKTLKHQPNYKLYHSYFKLNLLHSITILNLCISLLLSILFLLKSLLLLLLLLPLQISQNLFYIFFEFSLIFCSPLEICSLLFSFLNLLFLLLRYVLLLLRNLFSFSDFRSLFLH